MLEGDGDTGRCNPARRRQRNGALASKGPNMAHAKKSRVIARSQTPPAESRTGTPRYLRRRVGHPETPAPRALVDHRPNEQGRTERVVVPALQSVAPLVDRPVGVLAVVGCGPPRASADSAAEARPYGLTLKVALVFGLLGNQRSVLPAGVEYSWQPTLAPGSWSPGAMVRSIRGVPIRFVTDSLTSLHLPSCAGRSPAVPAAGPRRDGRPAVRADPGCRLTYWASWSGCPAFLRVHWPRPGTLTPA